MILTPWLVSGPGLDHEDEKECEAQEEDERLKDDEDGVVAARCTHAEVTQIINKNKNTLTKKT